MEAIVESSQNGKIRTYIGVTVCDGPGQHRLVLTRPYHEAGRIVEIPRSKIQSVTEFPSASLGEQPAV